MAVRLTGFIVRWPQSFSHTSRSPLGRMPSKFSARSQIRIALAAMVRAK